MVRGMRFTEQMYAALKLVQQTLDADVSALPMPDKYARLAQAWYEEQFGLVVREAIARAERGRR